VLVIRSLGDLALSETLSTCSHLCFRLVWFCANWGTARNLSARNLSTLVRIVVQFAPVNSLKLLILRFNILPWSIGIFLCMCVWWVDPAGRMDEMDNSPVLIQQPDTKMEDCISGGRYYLHGTTWHPVMGPFGPMDCVNCVCKSGRIECHRLECSDRRSLNCDKPVKVTGSCCPVCPLQGDNQGKEQFKPILSKYDPNPDPDLIFQSFFLMIERKYSEYN